LLHSGRYSNPKVEKQPKVYLFSKFIPKIKLLPDLERPVPLFERCGFVARGGYFHERSNLQETINEGVNFLMDIQFILIVTWLIVSESFVLEIS
jgi:hypothetical protein